MPSIAALACATVLPFSIPSSSLKETQTPRNSFLVSGFPVVLVVVAVAGGLVADFVVEPAEVLVVPVTVAEPVDVPPDPLVPADVPSEVSLPSDVNSVSVVSEGSAKSIEGMVVSPVSVVPPVELVVLLPSGKSQEGMAQAVINNDMSSTVDVIFMMRFMNGTS